MGQRIGPARSPITADHRPRRRRGMAETGRALRCGETAGIPVPPQPPQRLGAEAFLVHVGAGAARGSAGGRSDTSYVEQRKTTTSGCADTMRRVASMPFMSGILMSISTSAGCSSSTSAVASGPLDASPASWKHATRLSTAFTAERKGAWSSTTSTECGLVTRSAWHGTGRGRRVLPP